MRNRLITIITLLFLLLGGGLQAQSLKVISFNIRNSNFYLEDGNNAWYNRREAVVSMILEEQPAAIGLQEALIDQLSYLDRNLKRYRRVGLGRDNGLTRGEHMAIYYNIDQLELLSAKTRWLSTRPQRVSMGWDAACKRTVTIAHFRVKKNGKEFFYFNTHLDHVGLTAREESAKLIAALVLREAGEDTPVIVGGDMNTTVNDPIFEPFYEYCDLKEAREVARRTSHKNTYNAFGKASGSMIDHFFVRKMDVRMFRTLIGNYGVPYISDHYPIEILFRL